MWECGFFLDALCFSHVARLYKQVGWHLGHFFIIAKSDAGALPVRVLTRISVIFTSGKLSFSAFLAATSHYGRSLMVQSSCGKTEAI
jgi:hypothetical protein